MTKAPGEARKAAQRTLLELDLSRAQKYQELMQSEQAQDLLKKIKDLFDDSAQEQPGANLTIDGEMRRAIVVIEQAPARAGDAIARLNQQLNPPQAPETGQPGPGVSTVVAAEAPKE